MKPKFDKLVRFFNCFLFSNKKALENIGQVTNVELIVEVERSFTEVSFDFRMELQGLLNNRRYQFLDGALEFAEVFVEVGCENGV